MQIQVLKPQLHYAVNYKLNGKRTVNRYLCEHGYRFKNKGERVYIKKKTKRFLEKGKNKIEKPKVSLNEALSKLLETSLEYINENRFNAVVSKEGEVSIKMIGKIAGLMTQDIVVDIIKDGDIENLESLGEVSEVKKFKQTLHGEVIIFIRPLLLKLD